MLPDFHFGRRKNSDLEGWPSLTIKQFPFAPLWLAECHIAKRYTPASASLTGCGVMTIKRTFANVCSISDRHVLDLLSRFDLEINDPLFDGDPRALVHGSAGLSPVR